MKKKTTQTGRSDFWKVFNSLYLNKNKLPLVKAYKMAKEQCSKDGIANYPTERNVRYWMKNHSDLNEVRKARGEISHIRDWSKVQPADLLPAESESVSEYITGSASHQCPEPEACPLFLEFSPARFSEEGLRLVLTPDGSQRVRKKYLKSDFHPIPEPRNSSQQEPSFDRAACTNKLLCEFRDLKVVSACPKMEHCLNRARCALLGKTYPYVSSKSSYIPPIGDYTIEIGQALAWDPNKEYTGSCEIRNQEAK